MDNWMKVIFSDELKFCISQGDDAESFVKCCLNKIYEDDCEKKTSKFPYSLMIWDLHII